MELRTTSTTSRFLIVGVILTFLIVLGFTWQWSRKAVPDISNTSAPIEVVPERTPAEIISAYQNQLATLSTNLESVVVVSDAEKQINDFFFSVRVPEAARNAHLKAALEFKNTDPKKTNEQKLTAWKEIIKNLQTAVAAV